MFRADGVFCWADPAGLIYAAPRFQINHKPRLRLPKVALPDTRQPRSCSLQGILRIECVKFGEATERSGYELAEYCFVVLKQWGERGHEERTLVM
jgi:hypothetical protein